MKKILFSLFLLTAGIVVNAQVDSLTEYTGKYKFPEGSPVSVITVSVQNGILYASSDAGNSELVRNSGDVFTIVAFDGLATFKRDADKKIIGVKVEVQDTVMEGTKEPGTGAAATKQIAADLSPARAPGSVSRF